MRYRMPWVRMFARAAVLPLLLIAPQFANAQEVAAARGIRLELNNAQSTANGGCRLSIVINNDLDYPLINLGLEVVAFNKEGIVEQFLRLDFTRISSKKTRVLQFDLSRSPCNGIGRLHVNDVLNCAPADSKNVYCPDLLTLANRTNIDFGY